MVCFTRFDKMPVRNGRETLFIRETGHCQGLFKDHIRKLTNGLLNSHGGIVYFGVSPDRIITGLRISRKEEDQYRLAVDHTIGRIQPLVPANLYRLSFIDLKEKNNVCQGQNYKIIELKVSVGKLGDIYEDGLSKVYIIDSSLLIGPLHPQELRELILLKYKESIEGVEEVSRFATPHLAQVRAAAKSKVAKPSTSLFSISEEEGTADKGLVTKVDRRLVTYDEELLF